MKHTYPSTISVDAIVAGLKLNNGDNGEVI